MKPIIFLLLSLLSASPKLAAEPIGKLSPRIWIGSTNAAFDSTGTEVSGGAFRSFYDFRGDTQRIESSSFYHYPAFGLDWSNYDTELLIYTNGSSGFTSILDSTTLSNGYPIQIVHSVSSITVTQSEYESVANGTITVPGSPPSQTFFTTTQASSTNYSYYLSETRDTNRTLISFYLASQTNDSLHSQQVSLSESGGNDENNPDFVAQTTNTLDSLGNVILSVSDFEFAGFGSFSDVTSNSYVFNQKGQILTSISQFDSGADGTIDSLTVTTFTYDKSGNLTGQDAKQFTGEGTFQGETVTAYIFDQFGNLVYTETKSLDANGAVTGRTTDTEFYVPRGQALKNPPGFERFINRIRAGRSHGMHSK